LDEDGMINLFRENCWQIEENNDVQQVFDGV